MTQRPDPTKTDPALLRITEELRSREPIFHHPEFGTGRADFESMTDPEFYEVGASGRKYSRDYCIDTLVERSANPQSEVWEIEDFHCTRIARKCYLVTYTLIQDGKRVTRRSTIWRQAGQEWKILYHQGTLVGDGASP